jgi:hypothetical protein
VQKEGTVPLSDHEQRMLDQIESALYAEDPKFASSVRGGRVGVAVGRRRIVAGIGFVVGVVLLVTGLLLGSMELVAAVSIAGFLLMFGSVVFLLWGPSGSGPQGAVDGDGNVRERKKGRAANGQSFATRMEDRFRRRFP